MKIKILHSRNRTSGIRRFGNEHLSQRLQYQARQCLLSHKLRRIRKQKNAFYRLASVKQHKHQKLLVCGDFNATTAVSLKQTHFDGKNIIEDSICNDNGTRLKSFCRESGLCMAQTYFNHEEEERFTWISGNKTTKKGY